MARDMAGGRPHMDTPATGIHAGDQTTPDPAHAIEMEVGSMTRPEWRHWHTGGPPYDETNSFHRKYKAVATGKPFTTCDIDHSVWAIVPVIRPADLARTRR